MKSFNLELMTILIAPDKFKGSLTSFEVTQAIKAGLEKNLANKILAFPFADGGDGFAAVMKYYLHTDTICCKATDPLGRPIDASYEWSNKNKTAIIEMAVASGLVLLKEEEKNPLKTSSYGTGLIIKHAIENGAKKILLGLGGSATNDAGIGILSALGFVFMDTDDKVLAPVGENLSAIKKIIAPVVLPAVQFEIACDVQNTLYGPHGAAYIYAPQKGADKNSVELLDSGLKNFATVIEQQTSKDVAQFTGSGAAGGIAAGLQAFFNISLAKGVELVAAASNIKEQLQTADLLITGEGKIDNQSTEGKVTGYMASLAKQFHIDCIAVCGMSALSEKEKQSMGFKKIITLANNTAEAKYAIENASKLLAEKASVILATQT